MGVSANQLKPGMVIDHDGKLWQCLQSIHKTPGNLRAFVQAKMRNVRDGTQKEFRFSSTENLNRVDLREREMQFLFADTEFYNFMDTESFDQIQLSTATLGDSVNYLLPDSKIKVTFFDESPIGVALPNVMEFEIVEAEPGLKTATASASFKNAKIATGMSVKVPQFIDAGERIRIDTSTGEYLERASGK